MADFPLLHAIPQLYFDLDTSSVLPSYPFIMVTLTDYSRLGRMDWPGGALDNFGGDAFIPVDFAKSDDNRTYRLFEGGAVALQRAGADIILHL